MDVEREVRCVFYRLENLLTYLKIVTDMVMIEVLLEQFPKKTESI